MTHPYQLIISTNNEHKLSEIKTLAETTNIPILRYTDIFKDPITIIEDGNTFQENATKKVLPFPKHPDYIYLGEDSGIEVDALNGAPGIFSARYAGENATGEEMCKKLLQDLGENTHRSARYQAVMAIRFPDNRIIHTEGTVEGTISTTIRGTNGFGYDPIFIPNGYDQTFGELPLQVKHKQSHRFKALRQAFEHINTFIND